MFSNASNFTNDVDLTFAIIIGISLFFLIGLTFLMIYFMIKYNHKKNPVATDIPGHMGLEILWTVIPTILVLVMFYYGWAGYTKMRTAPKDAIQIKATGRMWSWTFEYENGRVTDTLVIPLNKAVKLNLFSNDVIHSLYIPAFRVKEDLVPGDSNWMWFIGQQIGSYNILCAEYCGDRHSYMISKVDVLFPEEYEKWYKSTPKKALYGADAGQNLLKSNGCFGCHSVDGKVIAAPSFKGIMTRISEVKTDKGEEAFIKVDNAYIIRSIEDPNKEVVEGFGKIMPANNNLTEKELEQIIDYLKTLK
ncbi:MAG: cytochrome c oxidase subunit II [Bacteroidetes bacterium CG2_30_33_31]|nr:MAG: cytochrome c oxidase subunit II [Bacteroidetes bacterium CG2_30_33_31]